MKEIKCIDIEQCDSMISAINSQGFKADRRYDSEQRCWFVWRVVDWEDCEDRRQAREAANAERPAAT